MYYRKVVAPDGEVLRWSAIAAWQRAWGSVAGQLALTSRSLIFEPAHLEHLIGVRMWHCRFDEIQTVGTQERDAALPVVWPATRFRRRLRIETRTRHVELFVVDHLRERLADVAAEVDE